MPRDSTRGSSGQGERGATAKIASAEAACKALATQGPTAELIDLRGLDLTALKDRIDVALLASHGLGGEDGKIQGALDVLGIPYTGSGVKASAVGMHKPTFKAAMRAEMIDTPRSIDIHPTHSTATIVSAASLSLGFPVFVKPASGGGSLETGIPRDEIELADLLERQRRIPSSNTSSRGTSPASHAPSAYWRSTASWTPCPSTRSKPTVPSTTMTPSTTCRCAASPARRTCPR